MPAADALPPHLHTLLLWCFERDLERRPTTKELLESEFIIAASTVYPPPINGGKDGGDAAADSSRV
jgi:hypothetical protein